MLRKKEQVHLLDLFGGVYTRPSWKINCWIHYPYVQGDPEIEAFQVAKQLEQLGILKVAFINGKNFLLRRFNPEEEEVSIAPIF